MIKELLCFLFGHNFWVMKTDYFGHDDIEHEIRHWKCSRCGEKKQKREDY